MNFASRTFSSDALLAAQNDGLDEKAGIYQAIDRKTLQALSAPKDGSILFLNFEF